MSGAHGRWNVTIKTPVGDRSGVLDLRVEGSKLTGSLSDGEHHAAISDGRIDGNRLSWSAQIQKPMRLSLKFNAVVDADRISGSAKYMLGSASFAGTRAT
jgi:hypothetical protein